MQGESGSLDGGLVQVSHLVGQLCAVVQPMLDTDKIQLNALFLALRHRVVKTHALDVAAITGAAAVGDDDVVERTLLGAATGKANPAAGIAG